MDDVLTTVMEEVSDKDEEIESLKKRIIELETMNALLIERVKTYEEMNVVKTIILLTKHYEDLGKRLQETEEKLKKTEEYIGKVESDTSLKGKFSQTLEDALNNKMTDDTPDIIKTIVTLTNSLKQ